MNRGLLRAPLGYFSATTTGGVSRHTPDNENASTSRQVALPAATLTPVTPHTPTGPGPEQLRDQLADHIRDRGTFTSARVETAFRTVPRHLFLPGVDLRDAYAPKAVTTKYAADGSAISSASSPNLVAGMLEQLDIQPGHRVLEIGAGTGYNAALMAELTGPGWARVHHRQRHRPSGPPQFACGWTTALRRKTSTCARP